MKSRRFWPRRNGKASSSTDGRPAPNSELLGFDLLYHLTYLAAVSSAGIPRSQIFQLASQLPITTASYFSEVERLAHNMNYEYSEACRQVALKTKDDTIKSLLLRLSGSLDTGEAEMDFLNHELRVQAETYSNQYERALESLKKYTDGFAAAVVSAVLIIVVAAVSTLIYDLGSSVLIGLVTVMLGISALGAWVIYRAAPKEVTVLTGSQGNQSQRLPHLLRNLLLPGALVIAGYMFATGMPVGGILVAVGATLLPLGWVSSGCDAKVAKRDGDITSFYRILGMTASSLGTTPTEAMGRLDLRSMASVAPQVKDLYVRLQSRAPTQLCWDRFVAETGSELIGRSARVFLDGVLLGGDAEEVGTRTSTLTMSINFLRAKRRLIATTFSWLTLALHATITFLLVFVIDVVEGFGGMVEKFTAVDTASGQASAIPTNIFSFSFANMQLLQWLTPPVILILCLTNALATQVTDGGYIHKFFFYLSLNLITAGGAMLVSPQLTGIIFGIVSTT